MSKLYVMQDPENEDVKIECRLITDDDPQIRLIPGEWVKVATCDPGTHRMRVGTIIPSGSKRRVTLHLKGGTYHGSDKIMDDYEATVDGSKYTIEVQ